MLHILLTLSTVVLLSKRAYARAIVAQFLSILAYLVIEVQRPKLTYKKDQSNITYILKQCFSIHRRFFPSFFLHSGHLQTVGTSVLRSQVNINFLREEVDTHDGGLLTLDWYDPDGHDILDAHDTRPTVVILHGLVGGSNETYVRHMILSIAKYKSNIRKKIVAFNFRGAAGSQLRTPVTYSAARTEDVHFIMNYIHKKRPHSLLAAIGFSLGANVLVKYLGESQENTPLVAAVSISNPYKLNVSSLYLENHWFNGRVYSRKLASNLKSFVRRHYEILKDCENVNIEEVLTKSETIRDFDEYATRRMWGFQSVEHYYSNASSAAYMNGVKIPLLCLSALDDPIVSPDAIPYEEAKSNPNILLAVTKRGGHVGWLQDWNVFDIRSAYMDDVAAEFVDVVLKTYK